MRSKVKRVLLTADTIGGVWVFAVELIRELQKKNIDVVLAIMGKKPTLDQYNQINSLNNIILEESTYKLEWMHDPWSDIKKAAMWLADIERKYAPDIIHLNEFSYADLQWSSPVILTAHSCVFSWFNEVKGYLPDESWNTYFNKVKTALNKADLVVSPTKTMMENLIRYYGPVYKRKVIHNGRNPKAFNSAEKEPFIFSAGRLWDEAKNIQMLANIALSLPWPVYVAGDYKNPDKEEIYFKNVKWLGYVSESNMSEMYSRASIYALPAKYEPFGLSILEAALSGCALVLGNIESLLELWDGCALFVDPDDPDELSAAINELIVDVSFRNKIVQSAHYRAEKFSSAKMASEYFQAYEKLMQLKTQTI